MVMRSFMKTFWNTEGAESAEKNEFLRLRISSALSATGGSGWPGRSASRKPPN